MQGCCNVMYLYAVTLHNSIQKYPRHHPTRVRMESQAADVPGGEIIR